MTNSSRDNSPRFRLFRASFLALDYLFPPQCLGCDEMGEHWCQSCEANLVPVSAHNCELCGKYTSKAGWCSHCRNERPFFDASTSLGSYEKSLANVVVNLKYRKNMTIGVNFAPLLHEIIRDKLWNVDVIIPLPLAKERLFERGYNQVEIFTRALSLYCDLPHAVTWLRRTKNTPKQVGLSFEERRANMLNAFSAEGGPIEGKSILLMDDVMTTGASLNSASKELKMAGAKKVYTLSIARANTIADHDFLIDNPSLLEE